MRPTCVQNGTPRSTYVAYSGWYNRSVGGSSHSHGRTLNATNPSSPNARCSSRTATGRVRSTPSRTAQRLL